MSLSVKIRQTVLLLSSLVVFVMVLLHTTKNVNAFIKFGYILNTTACDTCDELRTYSGRNVFCCLAQSKCCGSGTLFAPFRPRSANPDGFDSKMKSWILAVEEWAISNKKINLSIKDIHLFFVSETGIRPDKECIRLVFSEMKRRSKLVPINTLKSSKLWSSNSTQSLPIVGSLIDTKSWIGWGVSKFFINPATWALSNVTSSHDQPYSDIVDLSITDDTKFICEKSLNEISQNLMAELIRVSKAEKQNCFEWQHLVELIAPIMSTIIDATNSKEVLEMLELLMEYLASLKMLAIQTDDDKKLVKISNSEDSDDVSITKKDIAIARLLRARESLKADLDKYTSQAEKVKTEALVSYKRKEVAKAKSLLLSHQRLNNHAEQKRAQMINVEIMLDQLDNTDSNMMIMRAYKDGAEALKMANTNLDANTSILDDMYDANAEAHHLNSEMNQILKDISQLGTGVQDITDAELESELNEFIEAAKSAEENPNIQTTSEPDEFSDELERRLNSLKVCQDDVVSSSPKQTPRKNPSEAATT